MTDIRYGDWVIDDAFPRVRGQVKSVCDSYVWISYYSAPHGIPHDRAKKEVWNEFSGDI